LTRFDRYGLTLVETTANLLMVQKGGGLAKNAGILIPTVKLAKKLGLEEAWMAGEGAEARGG